MYGPILKELGTITSISCNAIDSNKTEQISVGFDLKTVNPLVLAPPHQLCVQGFRVEGNSYDIVACSPVAIPNLQPQVNLLETDKIISSCS